MDSQGTLLYTLRPLDWNQGPQGPSTIPAYVYNMFIKCVFVTGLIPYATMFQRVIDDVQKGVGVLDQGFTCLPNACVWGNGGFCNHQMTVKVFVIWCLLWRIWNLRRFSAPGDLLFISQECVQPRVGVNRTTLGSSSNLGLRFFLIGPWASCTM